MKSSLIITICFFFIVHTQDVWMHHLGALMIFLSLILLATFLFIIGSFLNELYFSVREKFTSRNRNTALIITTFVIGLTIWQPLGIVQYDLFSAESILKANRNSVANCNTTLELKKDGTFSETSFCFGMDRKEGVYRMKNDTIWFRSRDNFFYEFGIITTDNSDFNRPIVNLHLNKQDTLPNFLWIQE